MNTKMITEKELLENQTKNMKEYNQNKYICVNEWINENFKDCENMINKTLLLSKHDKIIKQQFYISGDFPGEKCIRIAEKLDNSTDLIVDYSLLNIGQNMCQINIMTKKQLEKEIKHEEYIEQVTGYGF